MSIEANEMREFREPSLADRREMAAKARQAALDKARAKSASNASGFAERQAERRAVGEARELRAAERKLAKAAAAQRAEEQRKAEQAERAAAAEAAKKAEAAAALEAAERAAKAKIESKAARDARYAARKSRKR
jgi:hypothetical protein